MGDASAETVSMLATEVKALTGGIKGLDTSVAEMRLEIAVVQAAAREEANVVASPVASPDPWLEPAAAKESWEAILAASQLAGDCEELRLRYDAMQELVAGRIEVSLQGMEKQLPEALRKVESLSTEQNERFAKVEENNVRLGLSLTRLGNCEERLRDCMNRLEQVPTASQARALWQEEVAKLMENINVDGLAKRIDMTLEVVAELHQEQQQQATVVRSFARVLADDEADAARELSVQARLPVESF